MRWLARKSGQLRLLCKRRLRLECIFFKRVYWCFSEPPQYPKLYRSRAQCFSPRSPRPNEGLGHQEFQGLPRLSPCGCLVRRPINYLGGLTTLRSHIMVTNASSHGTVSWLRVQHLKHSRYSDECITLSSRFLVVVNASPYCIAPWFLCDREGWMG